MKCPYCGRAMEHGFIQSPQEINWQKKKHLINRSDLHAGAVRLAPRSILKGSAVEAWLSRGCYKIVIECPAK